VHDPCLSSIVKTVKIVATMDTMFWGHILLKV